MQVIEKWPHYLFIAEFIMRKIEGEENKHMKLEVLSILASTLKPSNIDMLNCYDQR